MSAVENDLGHVKSVSSQVAAAVKNAKIDSVIGAKLSMIPNGAQIVEDVVAHATAAGEAMGEITAAIDLSAAAGSVQAGSVGASPINDAALKAGVAKLGKAVAIGPLIDKIEKALTDASVKAALKKGAADRGLTGGVDEAREALKSVSPATVALSGQIRTVINAIQNDQKLAHSPAIKASLANAETELHTVLDAFGKEVTRLMKVVDTMLATTFN